MNDTCKYCDRERAYPSVNMCMYHRHVYEVIHVTMGKVRHQDWRHEQKKCRCFNNVPFDEIIGLFND